MWQAFVGLIVRLFALFIQRKSAIVTEAEGLGEKTQQVADLQSQVKAEAAVANAEANSPSTLAGVEDRLNKGTF